MELVENYDIVDRIVSMRKALHLEANKDAVEELVKKYKRSDSMKY